MSQACQLRTLAWDWYPGSIPENVLISEGAHLETTYSFLHYRSLRPEGVRVGRGTTVNLGTMFDVGPRGRVRIGEFALVNSPWIICDAEIDIGDFALISWNVVLMDTYRASFDPVARRAELAQVARHPLRRLVAETPARPIRIGRNVWIGFDSCVLPGVTIGEGSVVGARSVVVEDVPPFTLVAGNPARVIRPLENDELQRV
jgi:acetyltransferase-like isoleucine patch superfamily enzyme